MVKTNANLLNLAFWPLKVSSGLLNKKYSTTKTVGDHDIKIGNGNNNKDDEESKPKNNYVKVLVDNPYSNRDMILKLTKKQKGVYV